MNYTVQNASVTLFKTTMAKLASCKEALMTDFAKRHKMHLLFIV